MYQLLSASKLNINLDKLAAITMFISNSENRDRLIEEILKEADSKIPEKAKQALQLTYDLCYERSFCESVKINYWNITAVDSRLIRAAIAYYLLKN